MASPVLLLLGVPESGTSALADALVRAGAALAGPPAGDPAGVSQHALAACGMRWDSLAPMPARLGKAPGLDAARAAIDVFLERMPSDAPLVVAEPLATRIVAMWRERAEAAERPSSTVLWLTHPGSAAAALARRRQFAPEKSLALWLAHLVEFEQATRGAVRTVVTEESLALRAASPRWTWRSARDCLEQAVKTIAATTAANASERNLEKSRSAGAPDRTVKVDGICLPRDNSEYRHGKGEKHSCTIRGVEQGAFLRVTRS